MMHFSRDFFVSKKQACLCKRCQIGTWHCLPVRKGKSGCLSVWERKYLDFPEAKKKISKGAKIPHPSISMKEIGGWCAIFFLFFSGVFKSFTVRSTVVDFFLPGNEKTKKGKRQHLLGFP